MYCTNVTFKLNNSLIYTLIELSKDKCIKTQIDNYCNPLYVKHFFCSQIYTHGQNLKKVSHLDILPYYPRISQIILCSLLPFSADFVTMENLTLVEITSHAFQREPSHLLHINDVTSVTNNNVIIEWPHNFYVSFYSILQNVNNSEKLGG